MTLLREIEIAANRETAGRRRRERERKRRSLGEEAKDGSGPLQPELFTEPKPQQLPNQEGGIHNSAPPRGKAPIDFLESRPPYRLPYRDD